MAGRYFGHDTLGTIGGLAVGLYAGNAVGNALAPKADAMPAEKPAEKPAESTPAVPFIGWSNNAAAQNAANTPAAPSIGWSNNAAARNAAKVARGRSGWRVAQRRESSAPYAREVETPEQSRSRQTTIVVHNRR